MNDNLAAVSEALDLTGDEIVAVVRNGFAGSFMPEADKVAALKRIDAFF
jgi:adenosine deaminase